MKTQLRKNKKVILNPLEIQKSRPQNGRDFIHCFVTSWTDRYSPVLSNIQRDHAEVETVTLDPFFNRLSVNL